MILHAGSGNTPTMRLTSDASVEFRFSLIAKLHQEGKSQVVIAHLLNCSQSWVSKFLKRYREQSDSALKVKHGTKGKKASLPSEQLEELKQLLLKGALHYGFPTDNWTRERIAFLIEQQFSVQYHPSHISKVMRRIGFTLQKPKRRSFKKDETAVKTWKAQTLPGLKKKGC
jgi:transposase